MRNENYRDRNMLTGELRNLRPAEKAKEFCRYFVEFGGLKPDGSVLDVGSGRGRMAIPLTGYLSDEGNYEGFDVVPERVRMCEEYITSSYPNFRFQLADIFNSSYNPQGQYRAENFVFPYEDSYFDFVFLNSVFTHMLPEAVENYVSEISRVLKPDGRCLITYFLLNKESQRLIEEGASDRQFRHRRGKWGGVHNPDIPERAVAYNEQFVRRLYDRHGLHLHEPIHYGSWSGRKEFLSRQDIVVATRSTSHHPRDESSMVQNIKSGIRRFLDK
jgi:SAM-dependent methyltransferase